MTAAALLPHSWRTYVKTAAIFSSLQAKPLAPEGGHRGRAGKIGAPDADRALEPEEHDPDDALLRAGRPLRARKRRIDPARTRGREEAG